MVREMARVRERVSQQEYPLYRQCISREEVADAAVRSQSLEEVTKDIVRETLVVGGQPETSAKFNHLRAQVSGHVHAHDLYWQGMDSICLPLIYAGMATEQSAAEIQENCLVFLETFYFPFVENNLQRYIEFEKIMRTLPGYQAKYPEEASQIPENVPREMDPIIVWFVRDFVFEEIVPLFCCFMKSPPETPFLFFLAALPELREKAAGPRTNSRCRLAKYTGLKRISRYLRQTKELVELYHPRFAATKRSNVTALAAFAVIGVAVAATGIGYMMLQRKDR